MPGAAARLNPDNPFATYHLSPIIQDEVAQIDPAVVHIVFEFVQTMILSEPDNAAATAMYSRYSNTILVELLREIEKGPGMPLGELAEVNMAAYRKTQDYMNLAEQIIAYPENFIKKEGAAKV